MFINIIILFIACNLLYQDKTTINKHYFIKQKGFILEKIHIFIFEKIPSLLSKLLDFTNNKIIKNFTQFILKLFDYTLSLFVLKNLKKDSLKTLRNIFIIIALTVLLTIFIALFGEK